MELVDALDDRHDECLEHMADTTTLRYQTERYHSALSSTNRAISRSDFILAGKESTRAMQIARQLFGFPLDLDMAAETFDSINQHAAISQRTGDNSGAEQDFREVIRLAKESQNAFAVSTDEIYLASLIETTDKTRLRESQTLADAAADVRLTVANDEPHKSCVVALLYIDPLRLGTEISIERDDYVALQSHLQAFDQSLGLLTECTDVAAPLVLVHDRPVNGLFLQSMLEIGDALEVKKTLLDGAFSSVRAAAVSRKSALELVAHRYGEAGVTRIELPILDMMLHVAEAPQN